MKISHHILELIPNQVLKMPEGAKMLSVQWSGSMLFLAVLADDSKPMQDRGVAIFGADEEIPDEYVYVASFVVPARIAESATILHLFDVEL